MEHKLENIEENLNAINSNIETVSTLVILLN
jgi:hypothetical protein